MDVVDGEEHRAGEGVEDTHRVVVCRRDNHLRRVDHGVSGRPVGSAVGLEASGVGDEGEGRGEG
eukprot:1019978-Prymnesium_polylepis.1